MFQALLFVIFAKMAAGTDLDLQEKYQTMPRHEFIEYFNSQNYTWKMKLNTETRPLLPIDYLKDIGNYPILKHEESVLNDIPENFDSREKWPHCKTIHEIYDQGHCGSCWTFGTGNTASDRTCIHKNIQVHLAEQDFQCLKNQVCAGGYPLLAFKFWKDEGLVTANCKPYDVKQLFFGTCKHECVDKNLNYTADKHFAERIYAVLGEERNIQAELFKNGPVQASFEVFSDFNDYHSGIYVHQVGNSSLGHSVRVLGYGVENGVHYWLAANSWGTKWGMNGLFKIKSYQKELRFEDGMYSGVPK